MSTTPTDRPAPAPSASALPDSARSVGGRLRRLLARIGAAVRSAHSASVPF
jgi:hypothetical protein